MGLRHRTPMAALREFRKCAEKIGYTSDRHVAARLTGLKGSLRFRKLIEGEGSTFISSEHPERAQRLIARLRDAIRPEQIEPQDETIRAEYKALQEELMRLTQVETAHRQQRDTAAAISEIQLPYSADDLVMRRIQITVPKSAEKGEPLARIEALPVAPSDLDGYRRTLFELHTQATAKSTSGKVSLCLVQPLAEEAEGLVAPEGAEIASRAVQLTLRSLSENEEARTEMPQSVKLSLLDA